MAVRSCKPKRGNDRPRRPPSGRHRAIATRRSRRTSSRGTSERFKSLSERAAPADAAAVGGPPPVPRRRAPRAAPSTATTSTTPPGRPACWRSCKPALHVDVSSSLYFAAIASAFVPVDYYEYRPVKLSLDNFRSRTADLLALPFATGASQSISCMHVVEHVGLGRYGDPLDPEGDLKAMAELQRVRRRPAGRCSSSCRSASRASCSTPTGSTASTTSSTRSPSWSWSSSRSCRTGGRGCRCWSNPPDGLADAQSYGCGCFWFRRPS